MSTKWKGIAIASAAVLGLSATVGRVEAQQTREILIQGEGKGDSNRFEPGSVAVRPGDILVFRVVSGAPHSVVFEPAGLSDADRRALNSALPGRSGDLASPPLAASGNRYRFTVPRLSPGRYRYFCLVHRAYDEGGQIVVTR